MPSESTVDLGPEEVAAAALSALSASRDAFRDAAAEAAEEVRAELSCESEAFRSGRFALELGRFAEGRIHPGRFAALFGDGPPLDPERRASLEAASVALDRLAAAPVEDLFRADVPPGGDLRDAVQRALARLGTAFGAAGLVEAVRSGRPTSERSPDPLRAHPFRRWSVRERSAAPPLVVTVDARDLHAGSLGDLLEGTLRLVLVVTGRGSPAPLARLVTPGVAVVQTREPEDVGILEAWSGPGVAGVFPDGGVVTFQHRPAAGSLPADRIRVVDWGGWEDGTGVGAEPRNPSWAEDLSHLRMLASLADSTTPLDVRSVGAGAARGRSGPDASGAEVDASGAGPGVGGGHPESDGAGPGPAGSGRAGTARGAGADGVGQDSDDPADRLAAWLLARTGAAGESGSPSPDG